VRERPLIVVPVDGSADGDTTVDYALALAGRRGADVDLLHVVRPRGPSVFDNPDIAVVGQTSSSGRVADSSDERASLKRPSVTAGPEGTHIRNVTSKGEPARAIAAYAQLSEAAVIIIGKGLTPIPYKLVTITSGFAGYNIWLFILCSVIARGGRFFVVAILLNRYGDFIRAELEKRLGFWVGIGAAVLVLGFYIAYRLI